MTQPGPLGSRYHLESLLGQGASGQVWRGRDQQGHAWAFKILHPELASDSTVLRRFIQERDVLAAIRHPNVVQVHDLVLEGSSLAIVGDLVDGPNLREVLHSRGSLPPALVARIGGELAAALASAHALGVVHRDVKPENVMMAGHDEGPAKLTDFGVAKLVGAASGSTMVLGTPQYMPPEFGDGQPPTAAGDLYSLGIMLYELLCGVTPFAGRGSAMAVLRAQAVESPGRPAGIPDPLWDIVAELTDKNPHRRPQTAAAVAERLVALVPGLAGLPAAPTLTSPPPTTPAAVESTPYGDPTRLRPMLPPQYPGAFGSGPYAVASSGSPYPSASSGGPGYVVPAGGGFGPGSTPPGSPIGSLPPGSLPAAPDRAAPRSAAVVLAAAGAVVLITGAVFAITQLRSEPVSAASKVPSATTSGSAQAPATNVPPVTVTAAPDTSTIVVTVTDRPKPATPPSAGPRAATDPGPAPGAMATGMPGTSCTPTSQSAGYGAYTRSMCDSMRRYVGSDGAVLEAGRTWVVCQRDLGIPNPVYSPGQTNTWWFFTRSDNRRWAWFPQTLLKQGAADRPINGIPFCG